MNSADFKNAHRHALCGLIVLVFFCGCANFRGVGQFQTAATTDRTGGETAEKTDAAPALELEGRRGFNKASSDLQFDWPVDEARMTRAFFASPGKRKRPHWGLDLANLRGTPILSAARGTVIYTGRAFHGYGRLIVIEHSDEWATMYAHLDKILVKEGQVVDKGDKIGRMGRSGNARGVHLHFEIRHFRQPVNPLAYLPNSTPTVAGVPRARPLQLTSQGSLSEHQDKP